MEINLRKASALVEALTDQLATVKLDNNVRFSVFDTNFERLIKRQRNTLLDNVNRADSIALAIQTLRTLVGDANATAGVNALLAERQFLKGRIARLSRLSTESERDSLEVLKARMEKAAKAPVDAYSRGEETIASNALELADIQVYASVISSSKVRLSAISDSLLEINVRTKIQVPDEVESVLNDENLV